MATRKKAVINANKGIWTLEEVAQLLEAAGLDVEMVEPNGDADAADATIVDEEGASE